MPITDLFNTDQLKQVLTGGNAEETTETIEAVIGLLFTLPSAIVKTELEKAVKQALPNFAVTVNIGTFKNKKALQVIIQEP